jgi:ubiquinone/menaquinone biosynthesis C-methylase UbiE
MPIDSVLDFAHTLATDALEEGDAAVDATVGNGHDTVVLARRVGTAGTVHGFDVQAEAIRSTRSRLQDAGEAGQVTLHRAGHETMEQHVPPDLVGQVGAVTFNLGYLPGSDSPVTTGPSTTIPALEAAVRVLRPGGVVTIVLYTGHEGGAREARAVDDWAADLPQEAVHALSYRFVNQRHDPPRLLALEKRSTDSAA